MSRSPSASPSAAPRMFDPLLRAAERVAVGINNKASLPSRGRLLTLFKMYLPSNSKSFDVKAFKNLLEQEFRNIPKTSHQELFDYISRGEAIIPLNQLVSTVLPERFTKERSVLDFPCTYQNASTAKETQEDAAETIRMEMIAHLKKYGLRMHDYFDKIDADNDHTIDTRELIASLRHDGMGIGRYHACRTLVHRFDSSRRGRLSYADFERLMQPETPQAQQRLSKIAASMLRRIQTEPPPRKRDFRLNKQKDHINNLQQTRQQRELITIERLKQRQMRQQQQQSRHPTLATRAAMVPVQRAQKLRDLKRALSAGRKRSPVLPVPYLTNSTLQERNRWA